MAANRDYLVKVGSYKIPLEMIFYKTYKVSRNVQDLDSYRDGDGKLHRNVLPHVAYKIEFETPYLTVGQFRSLIDHIRDNMTDTLARDVTLTFYDEETDAYKSGFFYMPGTMEYTRFNKNIYEPTRIAFIEY